MCCQALSNGKGGEVRVILWDIGKGKYEKLGELGLLRGIRVVKNDGGITW